MFQTICITILMGLMNTSAAHASIGGISVGKSAPNFTLLSQENKSVKLQDYKGKWVVLYFYPKDQTPGCMIEAHNFQTDLAKYSALNAVILGVSLDTVESHKTWCSKESFGFKLLADPNHTVIDAYGVPLKSHGDMKYANRETFLISPEGKVSKIWDTVEVKNHSTEGLNEIAQASKAK
jgi:peroxiredoxin Q/BCP